MTAEEFVQKWSKTQLSERAASHEHFIDLCHLLDQPTPAEADASGENYCFEKYVKVVGSASKGSKGDSGFVDVWKRNCFAWEYKGKDKHKTLDDAYRQVYQYRDDLDNPPLSIVCDIRTTEIRAHFPGYPTEKTVIKLEELPGRLETLRRVFTNPLSFKPEKTREQMTSDLADTFGDLADKLLSRSEAIPATLWHGQGDPVAHFLMKVMFCLFAEDIGLLPEKLFTKLIDRCLFEPENFKPFCSELFDKMKKGGWYGNDRIDYFNGGLFDDAPPLALNLAELPILARAAEKGWAAVEPSIFGTLFERILDPKKRAQIGAHYTSKADILLVIEPVIMTPLRRKWIAVQEQISPQLKQVVAETDRRKRDVISAPVRVAIDDLRRYLAAQRILDPASGSGNFLYVGLQQLLDLDDEIVRFAARYDIALNPFPYIRPTQLHGIEINPYAAELAQVVIWIGYLQWLAEHRIDNPKRPILDKLVTIKNEDAILDLSKPNLPTVARWPEVDFVVGNPPFLGSKMFRKSGLSDDYLHALWKAYDLPRSSDLCCYWFELARRHIERRNGKQPGTRVGLLATQAIRGGENREVLERIKRSSDIFMAWSDHKWVLDGAAVNVSIIGFDDASETTRTLDGVGVKEINANVSADTNVGAATELIENANICFQGPVVVGPFDIPLEVARQMLAQPNVNGRPNRDVILPVLNAKDLTARDLGWFIVDFGQRTVEEAAGYEAPFAHVLAHVKPLREKNKDRQRRERWWQHGRAGTDFRNALGSVPTLIVTPRVSKYRVFVRRPSITRTTDATVVFARADDYLLGALQSSVHTTWALEAGTQLEDRPRYTPSTTFDTFPLPWPPGKEDVKHPAYLRIAQAAKALNEQRERWLNPPEWIEPLAAKIDLADTFEDVPATARALVRQSAIMAAAAKDARLKKRTLTNLYNERPTWLKLAHEQLDRAVLAAYAANDPAGEWPEEWAAVWVDSGAGKPLPVEHPLRSKRAEVDQRVLTNLLRLNHQRATGATPTGGGPAKATPPHAHRSLDDPKLARALGEYRDGLRELYDPKTKATLPGPLDNPKKGPRLDRVVLFGSQARGTASPGSDVDVLIVLNGAFNPDREIERTSKLTADVSLRHGVMINRIVMNKEQADSRKGPLHDNICRDSLIL